MGDAVGALAWAAGPELDKPQYMQALVVPILAKFDAESQNTVLALPLCECLSNVAQVHAKSLASLLPGVVMHGIRIINDTAMKNQMWEQNPNEYERPANELICAICDLFAGVLEGLKEHAAQIAAQLSMLSVIPLALRNNQSRVKQSGYWLLKIGAKNCISLVSPLLPELMPMCAAGLGTTMSFTVSINACFAISEVAQQAPPEALTPYLGAVVPALLAAVQRPQPKHQWEMQGYNTLMRNGCTTLNHLRGKTALGQQWGAVCAQISAEARAKLQQRYGLSA